MRPWSTGSGSPSLGLYDADVPDAADRRDLLEYLWGQGVDADEMAAADARGTPDVRGERPRDPTGRADLDRRAGGRAHRDPTRARDAALARRRLRGPGERAPRVLRRRRRGAGRARGRGGRARRGADGADHAGVRHRLARGWRTRSSGPRSRTSTTRTDPRSESPVAAARSSTLISAMADGSGVVLDVLFRRHVGAVASASDTLPGTGPRSRWSRSASSTSSARPASCSTSRDRPRGGDERARRARLRDRRGSPRTRS